MKYVKIKSIKHAPNSDVYHLSVAKNHNFFANNICVHNCYRGSLGVKLYNYSDVPYEVKKGDRIAQMVFYPVVEPHIGWLDEKVDTERNEKGFGSSGK